MCDTLPTTTTHLINNYLKYGPSKFEYAETKESITEPDNGHEPKLTTLDYKMETERLKTYSNWKSEAVRPEDLAKAGFYFLNNPSNPDLVRCAFCNAEICSWEQGDDALEEHIKWAPNCPYAKEQCKRSSSSLLNNLEAGQDVCGSSEMFNYSMPESETFRLLGNLQKSYENENLRLESFKSWPNTSKQTPAALVDAGFFYRGVEDHTICFSCGGALRDWKDDDVPWEQHALWFPTCKFVVARKGPSYIDEIKRKFRFGVPSNSVTKEETKECGSEKGADGILLCKICDSNERNVIFLPCKHILACDECSRQFSKCPVCREKIDQKTKVFLS